jgi:DNA-binding CsgD family transcriptional regulator
MRAPKLRTAEEMYSAMGAKAFADRARRELLATGEQEGLSNNEIGEQLFISPRTVQYSLELS